MWLKIIKEIGKRLFRKKPKPPKKKPAQSGCKTGCSPKNPYKNRTREQNEKSKKSYEQLRDEHKQKLEDYKADPAAHDNKGTYRNAPDAEVRQRVYEGRIRELERQIQKHEGELRKIQEALDGQ